MQPITPDSLLQGIIFDFGGTLSITTAPYATIIAEGAAAMSRWLRQHRPKIPEHFSEQWVSMMQFAIVQGERDGAERSAEDILGLLLDALDVPTTDRGFLFDATDANFRIEDSYRRAATGAGPLLSDLKAAGYRVGILSNTISGRWVRHWVDTHGFRPYVDAVVVSDEFGLRKPRPEIFLETLARMGMDDQRRGVMVGDTLGHDIAGACALGIRTVLVLLAEDQAFRSEPGNQQALAMARPPVPDTLRADAQINALAELPTILEQWQRHGE